MAIYAARLVRDASIAAGETLTTEELQKRVEDLLNSVSPEPLPVSRERFDAEMELVRVGARRSGPRRETPANSNGPLIKSLQKYDADILNGRLTQARLNGLSRWLKLHYPALCPATIVALRKAIQRARKVPEKK